MLQRVQHGRNMNYLARIRPSPPSKPENHPDGPATFPPYVTARQGSITREFGRRIAPPNTADLRKLKGAFPVPMLNIST